MVQGQEEVSIIRQGDGCSSIPKRLKDLRRSVLFPFYFLLASHQAIDEGFGDCFGAGVDLQLFVDLADVKVDGVD